MPRIIVQTDPIPGCETIAVLQERVSPMDLESAHFRGQLVERISWAVGDAKQAELEHVSQVADRVPGFERRRFEQTDDRLDAELDREPALLGY